LRSVKAIHRGYRQLLVQLALPQALVHTLQQYVLHPALLDGVLQSAIALATDLEPVPGQTSAPSGLESLQLLSPCTAEMYAWVHYSRGSNPQDPAIRLDVDVMDSQGVVCLQMKSLAFVNARWRVEPELQGADFAALLDCVYGSKEGSQKDESEPADDAFEKLLEEIL
jgi:hypothetical protein